MARTSKTSRRSPHKSRLQSGLLLLLVATIVEASPPDRLQTDHQYAIQIAREGRLPDALAELALLRLTWPDDMALLNDEIVVLSWNGDDQAVIERSKAIDTAGAPDYVISAIAKSCRNLQRYDEAADWYRMAIAKAPEHSDYYLGLAMSEADGGHPKDAWLTLQRVPEDQQNERPVRLTRAYLFELQKRSVLALTEYGALLDEDPNDSAALRGKALALRALLLPVEALELARAHPGILNKLEIAHLEADNLTLAMRVAVLEEPPADDPYGAIDQVLQRFDQRIAQQPTPTVVMRRLRSDRLVALVERFRFAEAVQEYEALRAVDPALPAYVHSAAGRAYLKQRRPELALVALQEAQLGAPGDIETEIELFYTYAELGDYEKAIRLTEGIVRKLAPARQIPGRPAKPNPVHMQARILSAVGRAYADRLDESQEYLERLVADAPGNTEARHELANIYLWRGWTDQAAAQYAQILTLSPDLVSVRVDQSIAELDRQHFGLVAGEIEVLRHVYADHPDVQFLQRRWDLHNRSQLLIETNWGDSSGTTFGSSQYDINGWWFSRPFSSNYRAFVHTVDSQAGFPAGNVSRRRAGIGLDYRQGRWDTRAELQLDRDDGDDLGLASRIDYRWSDRWSVGGLLEFNSNETPLRAFRAGVSSDLLGLDVRYRWHESMRASSGLRFQDFSDGNRRFSWLLDASRRWINRPRYKLDLTGNLFASSNSLDGVPYYNPSRDLAAEIGLNNRWRLYRHYDRRLVLRIHGKTGIYDQKQFGHASIWSLDTELIWEAENALQIRLGWRRDRRVYDGAAEYGTYFLAALEGRF